MQRARKILVILSVVLAVSAVQMPASATPDDGADVVCWVTTEVHKYGWHVQPVCL